MGSTIKPGHKVYGSLTDTGELHNYEICHCDHGGKLIPAAANDPKSSIQIINTNDGRMLTFDFQDQIRGGGVADKALWSDAPEVDLVVQFRGETHAASCYRHTATGTQAALLQQLETQAEELVASSAAFRFLFFIYKLDRPVFKQTVSCLIVMHCFMWV